MFRLVTLLSLAAAALATEELTAATFDAGIAGKSAFVKFFAPWCGHCKKLKPAWDQLAEEFKANPNVAIIDVDCTKDESKSLCSKFGVKGYPTVKYFTDSTDAMGADYKGGRTFEDLKKFADENLGPSCSPDNMELCDEEQTEAIKKYMAMDIEELKAELKKADDAVEAAETTFKEEVEKLQAKYQTLMTEKDAALEAASTPDLKYMRAVVNSAAKGAKHDEL